MHDASRTYSNFEAGSMHVLLYLYNLEADCDVVTPFPLAILPGLHGAHARVGTLEGRTIFTHPRLMQQTCIQTCMEMSCDVHTVVNNNSTGWAARALCCHTYTYRI